ncbi:hypothetical protein ABZ470_31775 [Streptosporangium sp. NPDC020072]
MSELDIEIRAAVAAGAPREAIADQLGRLGLEAPDDLFNDNHEGCER